MRPIPRVTLLDHARGPADATVTLIEYADFECPDARAAQPLLRAARAALEEQGASLRVVHRHFPLVDIHPFALHAALAAESVAAQRGEEAFWAMHDALFAHQRDSRTALSDRHLAQYAAEVGADPARVAADLAREAHRDRVRTDVEGAVAAGVHATPTFVVDGVVDSRTWRDGDAFLAALTEVARRVRGRQDR